MKSLNHHVKVPSVKRVLHSYSTNACFDEKFSLAIKKCKSNNGSMMELFFTVTLNGYIWCIYTSG